MTAQTFKITDDISANVGIDSEGKTDVARALSSFLASTYTLYTKTLYYHWNVTGPNFYGLHNLFEEQYQDLHVAGDELAERVRALGHMTPGTYKEFSELSVVKDDASPPTNAEKMCANLLHAHETCSQQARKVLEIADEASDEVTVDMMVARMTFHDKASWMLRSIIE